MGKVALITGITGQDGSYLAELLLEKGYELHGIIRRVALEDPSHRLSRIAHIRDRIKLHSATLESYASLCEVIRKIQPDELYHLAGQSFVAESFDDSFSTLNININGTHYLLASARAVAPQCRIYFAGTSEMFGKVMEVPQRETTPFRPRSPYGISKVASYELARNYREAYGMFVATGFLFNHESPRRGHEFVTRKITHGVARIKRGLQKDLSLGNLESKRDWGHAKDYVRAMQLMLQLDAPDDFVVATGQTHSVREFCERAFRHAGLDYHDYVRTDPQFVRPTEVELLVGDASKARAALGWRPTYSFEQLVDEMVDEDLKNLS